MKQWATGSSAALSDGEQTIIHALGNQPSLSNSAIANRLMVHMLSRWRF